MTTAPSVSPTLSPLHSERASPFPRSSARTGAGVAFPGRPYGPLLRLRSPVMSAGGVGGNGPPVAPEDYTVSPRLGEVKRVTEETNAHVKVSLDGTGVADCSTGIPFLDHMLDLVEHFFQSLVNTFVMTLHICQLAGNNSHHIIEACFKAFARALRQATEYDLHQRGTVPSSKGVLSRSWYYCKIKNWMPARLVLR